ncbi:MAG: hypothetical protein M1830_008491 [Pleopsidium flavum]|nr:MAG: hypothetical protein M1830_008491 [Pleopsidium flavum]
MESAGSSQARVKRSARQTVAPDGPNTGARPLRSHAGVTVTQSAGARSLEVAAAFFVQRAILELRTMQLEAGETQLPEEEDAADGMLWARSFALMNNIFHAYTGPRTEKF